MYHETNKKALIVLSFVIKHSRCVHRYPWLKAYEMHILYDRHHKVSSWIIVYQNTPNSFKLEQYGNVKKIRSVLDISDDVTRALKKCLRLVFHTTLSLCSRYSVFYNRTKYGKGFNNLSNIIFN